MPVPGESLSPSSRRKMIEDERNEKKLINQKVADVRQVVHNKSNNDIVLALHNFDMDVERTIQAFCEDGAQAALETWTTGSAKSRNKKKKKPKKGTGNASDSLSSASPLPPFSQSETPTSPPGSVSNGDIGSDHFSAHPSLCPADGRNQLLNGVQPRPQRIASGPRWQGHSRGDVSGPQRPTSVTLVNGDAQHLPEQSAGSLKARSLDPVGKKKAGEKELKNLARHDAVEERVQLRFSEEIEKAGDRIRRSFEELRKVLAERETQLCEELSVCKEDGNRILSERMEQARQLHTRGERTAAMSEKEIADLRNEIKQFTSDRKYEEELGSTIRFRWDPDPLIVLIKNFGEVVGVKPFVAQKHSSHSSLVSSVGEDSGLGMTSPVSPTEEKKAVAEVESCGIVMKSESLTSEQLEDLNRRLMESLQLQGITTDILQGVGGVCSMPPRRPRPPPGSQRGAAGVSRRGRGGRGRGGSSRQPNLSIFAEET